MNHYHYYQSEEQELKMNNTKLIPKSETPLKLHSFSSSFFTTWKSTPLRIDIKGNQSKEEEKEHSLENKRGWNILGCQTRIVTNSNQFQLAESERVFHS